MSKHTPGPAYTLDPDTAPSDVVGILNAKGHVIAEARKGQETHIVACLNACEGLNPEAVPEVLLQLRTIAKRMQHNGSITIDADSLMGIEITEAIAKAEGKS